MIRNAAIFRGGNAEYIGNGGTATFYQQDTSTNTTGELRLAYQNGSSGSYYLSGGVLNAPLMVAGAGTTNFYLNGGTLQAYQVLGFDGAASSNFYFNGGTWQTSQTDAQFSGWKLAAVQERGAIIDNTDNIVQIYQPLAHGGSNATDGGLTKWGGGSVILLAPATYTGDTRIYDGTFSIGSGGSLGASSNIIVGAGGLLSVTGNGSLVSDTADLTVDGTTVKPATVSLSGTTALTRRSVNVGASANSDSLLYLSSGSLSANTAIFVGNDGNGKATIQGGTLHSDGNVYLGFGGSGQMTQNGDAVTAAGLFIGNGTGTGNSYGLNNGTLTTTYSTVGAAANTSIFTQNGGTHSAGLLEVAASNGSQASYALNGGTLLVGNETIGDRGNGVFNQTGGTHTIQNGALVLGSNGGTGTYNLAGGPLSAPSISAGGGTINGGNGTFTLSGGTVTTNSVSSGNGAFTFNLNGGTLHAETVGGGNSGVFNLNGGTLQANSSNSTFGNLTRANVQTGGLTVDTNGFSYAINQSLLHDPAAGTPAIDGGLHKINAGNLALAGVNTYTGPTLVSAGTLTIASGGRLGDTDIDLSAGTRLNFNNNGAMNSATAGLAVESGAIVNLGGNTANSRGKITVGGVPGTAGAINQSSGSLSASSLVLGDVAGSAGNYFLFSSSNPTLSATTVVVGDVGTGSFNLSTGSFTAGTTTIGNLGTGTFTQAGGTATVNTALLLGGAGGSGTYTLNGGTLTASGTLGVGGASRFNQSAPTSTFNQEASVVTAVGGVVIGRDANSAGVYNLDAGTLVTSSITGGSGTSTLAIGGGAAGNGTTIQASADSANFLGGLTTAMIRNSQAIFDTNGHNITVAQGLAHSNVSGDNATDGGVAKTGAGTLILTKVNSYTGNTVVYAGTLVVNGYNTSSPLTLVNDGATLGGRGLIQGNVFIQPGGILAPGAGSQVFGAGLSVFGSLSLSSTSTLALRLGGTTAGTDYDGLAVGGQLTLGGNLQVTLTNGFVPPLDQVFKLVDDVGTTATSGTFANVLNNVYTDAAGDRFMVDYAANVDGDSIANDVTLTYLGTTVPEPGTWSWLAAGVAGLGWRTMRRSQKRKVASEKHGFRGVGW